VSDIIALSGIRLIPVLELQPTRFATVSRSWPAESGVEVPEEWHRYWSDSLADSGLTRLIPIRFGSWHVPVDQFLDPAILRRLLEVNIQQWDGIASLSDPDHEPRLDGGMAFCCPSQDVLIEPGCCADLSDAPGWRIAASYRGTDWEMLWIGHPWISVMYQEPSLILSDRHESNQPNAHWSIDPDELLRAAVEGEAELEAFAEQIAPVLTSLGFCGDPNGVARQLAGFSA